MLDAEIRQQLEEYLKLMEQDVELRFSKDSRPASDEMDSFLQEIASLTPHIHLSSASFSHSPAFSIARPGGNDQIIFSGVPLGHEFTSFVLALLQISGRSPKEEERLLAQIRRLKGVYSFESFISLSCHNCPDVVQALNLMSVINPNISNQTIDGALFQEELQEKDILAVPTVYLNGSFFHSGRISLEELLEKLQLLEPENSGTQEPAGEEDAKADANEEPFDVLVIGAGPAGASAAVYAARKGIRTGIIADRIGGQVLDTSGIENLIGTLHTTGTDLASGLQAQLGQYPISIIRGTVKTLVKDDLIHVTLTGGRTLKSRTLILATGARWRQTGVPGEDAFKNKGVAYCPHCDGPLFAGKDVAVIGGGNSGLEAAIDLANIADSVTILEFLPELKADQILVQKAESLPNIQIVKNAATKEITGSTHVEGITYTDRTSGAETKKALDGVFVQIGLVPNTEWLGDFVERNKSGEIIVDSNNATSVPGVFAAGDCTTQTYKQIIISMGSGASAALAAFDHLIRTS